MGSIVQIVSLCICPSALLADLDTSLDQGKTTGSRLIVDSIVYKMCYRIERSSFLMIQSLKCSFGIIFRIIAEIKIVGCLVNEPFTPNLCHISDVIFSCEDEFLIQNPVHTHKNVRFCL